MRSLLLALAAAAIFAPSLAGSAKTDWPDLPRSGFIVGRPATPDEAATGKAPFSLAQGGHGIIPVAIPQYVYFKDASGTLHPAILLQAEKGPNGTEFAGIKLIDGTKRIVPFPHLILLGTAKPKN